MSADEGQDRDQAALASMRSCIEELRLQTELVRENIACVRGLLRHTSEVKNADPAALD